MSDPERIRSAILSSLQSELDGTASKPQPSEAHPKSDAVPPPQAVPNQAGKERPKAPPPSDAQPRPAPEQLALLRAERERAKKRAAHLARRADAEAALRRADPAAVRPARIEDAAARRADPVARQTPARPARIEEVARLQPIPHVVEPGNITNITGLPPLPKRGKKSWTTTISFFLFVIVPTLLASIYYIFIASNQYVSEFKFAVRQQSQGSSTSSAGALAPLISATTSISGSGDDYMVADYLTSRQVIDDLQSKIDVIDRYSKPSIDWWSRFNRSKPVEKFVDYWQYFVTSNYDQITGIATARVRAFSADDAYLIAKTMASLAEKLVNDISMRPRLDAVKFAEQEQQQAENRMRSLREQLSKYRDAHSVIDPTTSVVTSNTTLAQSLRATLSQDQTNLGALLGQHVRPTAPTVVNLKARIKATREQLAEIEAEIAKTKEGNQPLSQVVGQYEHLQLELQFAQTILTAAVQNLQQARANAAAQQEYISAYVQPARAQSSTYPNRPVAIGTVALACFFSWTIGLLIVRSIREHLA